MGPCLSAARAGAMILAFAALTSVGSAQPQAFKKAANTTGWRRLPALPVARGALTAECLDDGLYVMGGAFNWSGSGVTDRVDRLDLTTQTWSSSAAMPDLSTWGAASLTYQGKIYVIGGWSGGGAFVREYDPDQDSWQYKASMPGSFTYGHGVARIGSTVYVIGGTAGAVMLAYDLDSESTTTGLNSAFFNTSSMRAEAIGGHIYLVGTGGQLQIYDPGMDSWSNGPSLPVTTYGPATEVVDDRLYVMGGASADTSSGGDLNVVQIFDPATSTWRLWYPQPTPRFWSAAAHYRGSLYVAGGFDVTNNAIDNLEAFVVHR